MSIIPLVIMAVVVTVFSVKSMETALQNEALSGLQATATAVNAGYTSINSDPYSINEDGDMVKGDFNITQNEAVIDAYTENMDTDVTIFYGDTRMPTSLIDAASGKRITGTQASDIVKQTVYENGEIYTTKNLTVNNQNYYCYYMPLENPDGSIAGIVFAGQPSADIQAYI
ncbi:MAG: cache domain-containing protein [Lachnospiraceae bacterium]|nr:cache domain-containing protein [Lachnospiraceae bacterium]